MAAYYGLFVTLHLLCALTFVGAVFFEVLVIEPMEKTEAIPRRVRTFMPIVIAVLYTSGTAMFWVHYSARPDFFHTKFGLLLTAKILLTFIVLGVFVASMRAARRGTMDVCRFRHTHRIVASIMLGIVLLAKGMFYL
jgi:hypothetical protein